MQASLGIMAHKAGAAHPSGNVRIDGYGYLKVPMLWIRTPIDLAGAQVANSTQAFNVSSPSFSTILINLRSPTR
jgi:hypothetical protein